MHYKRFIASVIIFLLILALATSVYFLRLQKDTTGDVDLTNKVHSMFYQDAVAYWDAKLTTGPFREGSSSAVRLTWTQPEEIYNHFLMTITDARSGWTRTESGEHDRVSLDVTSLQPDTKYTFVVRACIDVNCNSWMISHQEVDGKTEQMIWKLTQETRDLSLYPDQEEWQTRVQLENILLQNENGDTLSSEQKNAFTIERITRAPLKSGTEPVMTLKDSSGKLFFAKLINP